MRTNVEKIELLLELLEAVMKRPKMYLGADDDALVARAFLSGIRVVVEMLSDIDPSSEMFSYWHTAIEAHGYRVTPRGPEAEMADRGMSRQDIVLELIRIEQSMYRSFIAAVDGD